MARFKRRILHAPNAIQTMHNEEAYLIIYCLNCIRCMQNSTFETGLCSLRPRLHETGTKSDRHEYRNLHHVYMRPKRIHSGEISFRS